MRQRESRGYRYRLAVLAAAAGLALAAPAQVLAAANKPDENTYQPPEPPAIDYSKDLSPEFAYTGDKWAALRDNTLEYGEIADLVHEYNPTVRSNRASYGDAKSRNLTDANEELWQDAQDLWDDAGSTDTDSYMGRMTEAQLNFAANSLAKAADQNYKDAEMYKIQYDQTEANLVFQAQQLMISYEQAAYTMENLTSSRALAQSGYEAVKAQRAVGMATEMDELNALKSVQDLDTSILSTEKSTGSVHRSLCLMLGWSADAKPDIRPLPQPDPARIEAMNPQTDREQALANNYDIKYYQRMKDNVASDDLRATAQANIDDARNKVDDGLSSQYSSVLNARDSLTAAQTKLQLETENLNIIHAKAAVGEASSLEVQQQQNAFTAAENGVETAKRTLFLAMEKYDWIKKGLTF